MFKRASQFNVHAARLSSGIYKPYGRRAKKKKQSAPALPKKKILEFDGYPEVKKQQDLRNSRIRVLHKRINDFIRREKCRTPEYLDKIIAVIKTIDTIGIETLSEEQRMDCMQSIKRLQNYLSEYK